MVGGSAALEEVADGGVVAAALMGSTVATELATPRLAARFGARRVLVSALGVLALVLVPNPAAVLAGMVVFGAGFGVAQNASLSLMFERVPACGYGAVSAVWNLAYDAGLGGGAAGFGPLIGPVGYADGFAVTAGVLLAGLALARGERAATSPGRR